MISKPLPRQESGERTQEISSHSKTENTTTKTRVECKRLWHYWQSEGCPHNRSRKCLTRSPTCSNAFLLNPTGSLSDLNLDDYTVLDHEPLHNLKSHLIHLCKELLYLLSGDIRKGAEDINAATVRRWVVPIIEWCYYSFTYTSNNKR